MRSLPLIAILYSATASGALAQSLEAGQSLAERVCSRCHAVLLGEGVDPDPEPLPFKEVGRPLPFEDIANTPGITEAALYAWLTSSHPTMPNIVIEDDELKSLVAYIMSLRRSR